MTGAEAGFLLLTSHLGDYNRKVLTVARYRHLASAMQARIPDRWQERELGMEDLLAADCSPELAEQILRLLSEEEKLRRYLQRGWTMDCCPVTRVSEGYPLKIRKLLGQDAPGCLWLKGDPDLLKTPMVSLVGSRELHPENLEFAREAGRQAALQGYTLVSGNAPGADSAAQESCLAHGGTVVCVVADKLEKHPLKRRTLYVSEDSYDLRFSATRALSRNRIIHCLGQAVLVAQCTRGRGGTWDGTTKNLQNHWTPVRIFADGSMACKALIELGGTPISTEALSNLKDLCQMNQESV